MLPEAIDVLGRVFLVEQPDEDSMGPNAGLCDYSTQTLSVVQGLLPIDETDTLLHELFHAILYAQGRPQGGKTEETYVRALATGLTAVLQQNPKLLSWLTSRFPHAE